MKDKLLALKPADLADLIPLLVASLDENQAMIYFRAAPAQKLIADLGWDNRVLETDGDYFYVVDANLGGLKTDPNIERKIEYHVETQNLASLRAQAASLQSIISITYANRGQFDWKTTRYRTYARVYVPLGSRLIAAAGNERRVDITQEHGKTVFGTFISIEPGQSETLSFTYQLPDDLARKIIQEKKYNLLIQKQAGTYSHKLSLDITAPFSIQKIAPDGILKKVKDRQAKGGWDLSVDRTLNIAQN